MRNLPEADRNQLCLKPVDSVGVAIGNLEDSRVLSVSSALEFSCSACTFFVFSR
jgi:hypothetical protein